MNVEKLTKVQKKRMFFSSDHQPTCVS